ncbi:hypothetical protein [Erythrobacter sp. JK5]|uniref:hypothetical protein n=1 Tax=Erythrobacter sp. JK5 TaxID=2829500 RepID=UPI001BAD13CC|nr:hypothetical protein [Erythrobacter sp. JK5]QUL36533.1 hypothetical protein KDC96_08745 [Erythrobacter sp. JK5]
MVAINQEAFDRPETLKLASGQQLGRLRHFPDGDRYSPDGGINGGIIGPKRLLIPAGTVLVRFGGSPWRDARPFVPKVASGEWWLDWPNYRTVELYADKHGESIAYAVRHLCAVPDDWSDMSFLIQGVTRSPLLAYTGEGRAAVTNGGTIDPRSPGKPRLFQLFIPGLSSPDLRKQAILIKGQTFLDPAMSQAGALAKKRADDAMRVRLSAAVRR